MVELIEWIFPALRGTDYQITSSADDNYNCIAWAAGDTTHWWWPQENDPLGKIYWPAGVPRVETLEAFRAAFASLGYVVCDDDSLEPDFAKIAVFALLDAPKHAARQLPNGRWTSKLGPLEDIEHALQGLTGQVYGKVVLIMKRPIPSSGSEGSAMA